MRRDINRDVNEARSYEAEATRSRPRPSAVRPRSNATRPRPELINNKGAC